MYTKIHEGTEWDAILIKLTAFVAIAGVFGILAWIGYTLATTPPPKPIEEIEKEIESEMKNLEAKEQKPPKDQTGERKKESPE
ncbi:MAG: transcriptional regulator [Thermoprotei archaeon]